ncbi:MAG TPA: cytochrome c [Candidatus Dormibacteraeota bacterium]|nr:cytochrome c [Candidatus Dormibacteraeota bacterium]
MLKGMMKSWGQSILFLGLLLYCAPAMRAQNGAEKTFKAKCAGCHGADGKGSTPAGKAMGAHDFASAAVQKMTDAELAEDIAKGKGKMPKYEGKLKEEEIKDLAAYVRKLGKKK